MKVRSRDQRKVEVAHLKLRIIHQQELSAKLAKAGKRAKATVARAKLLALLNQLDLLRERSSQA